jgi:hypothetical protein
VFSFGGASFFGSAEVLHLAGSVAGLVATPQGKGYWLVADDGGVFAFGAASFFGSAPGPGSPQIAGLVADADGRGYSVIHDDGTANVFGS